MFKRRILSLAALALLCGCAEAHSTHCGSGTRTDSDVGSFCSYIVIEGGFTCPAFAPTQLSVGTLTVCAPMPIALRDLPPEVCMVTGHDCPTLLSLPGQPATPPTGVPRRPPGTDAGGDVGDLFVALTRPKLSALNGEGWASTGFDLDGQVTTAETTERACQAPEASELVSADGVNGTDNVFGQHLFPILELLDPELPLAVSANAAAGRGALLLRVRGWNGLTSDPSVEVMVASTVDGTSADAAEASAAIFVDHAAVEAGTLAALPEPNWDGADHVWVREDAFGSPSGDDLDASSPLAIDPDAYVSNGVLVFSIPDGSETLLQNDLSA